jgi:hypothetical protein
MKKESFAKISPFVVDPQPIEQAFLPQEGIRNCPSFAKVLLLFKQSSKIGKKMTDSLPHLHHTRKKTDEKVYFYAAGCCSLRIGRAASVSELDFPVTGFIMIPAEDSRLCRR